MLAEVVGRFADGPLHPSGFDAVRAGAGRMDRGGGPMGRPSEVNAWISCRAPYNAGRMISVSPASMTICRPSRSRTWSTRPTTKPARATSARPGSIARRVGRRSAGAWRRSAGTSRAKRAASGVGSSSGKIGKPPPTSSVSKGGPRSADEGRERDAAADRVAPARRRIGVASRHGGGCRAVRGRACRRRSPRPR